MAKNVVKSHFSFARNYILVENIAFRSSPLRVAANRYQQVLNPSTEMRKFIIVFTLLIAACSFKKEKLTLNEANSITALFIKYNIQYLGFHSIDDNKFFINDREYVSENKLVADYRIDIKDWKFLKQVISRTEIESIEKFENDILFQIDGFNGSFYGYWKTDKNPVIKTNLDAINVGRYIITSSKKIDKNLFEVNGSW